MLRVSDLNTDFLKPILMAVQRNQFKRKSANRMEVAQSINDYCSSQKRGDIRLDQAAVGDWRGEESKEIMGHSCVMSRSVSKRADRTQSTTGGIALKEEQRCPSIIMIRKVST